MSSGIVPLENHVPDVDKVDINFHPDTYQDDDYPVVIEDLVQPEIPNEGKDTEAMTCTN